MTATSMNETYEDELIMRDEGTDEKQLDLPCRILPLGFAHGH